MKYKPGDKIQLINEAVEGTVSRMHSELEVFVLDENGFEYKVNVSEIVPLSDENDLTVGERVIADVDLKNVSEKSVLKYFTTFHSCFLCIVPKDFEQLFSSDYFVVMVNSSEEALLYSLHFSTDVTANSWYGTVEPKNETSAATSNFKLLPMLRDSNQVLIRFIIHSEKNKTGHREYSFVPEDFLNEKLFLSRDLFRNHILAFDINADADMEIPEGEIKKLVDYFSPEIKIPRKDSPSGRKRNEETVLLTNEKTVDLHIEELTSDYSGMSSVEMVNLQLSHFRKELDSAMLNHFYRIIFIHGKGNGVLKDLVRRELDAMNLKYTDADTARFGYGATEVLL